MFEKRTIAALASAAILGFVGVGAHAQTTEPVDVEVRFVEPITITVNNAMQFGLVDINIGVGETLILATNDTVTGTGAPARLLNTAQLAADLTVEATANQAINILVNNEVGGSSYDVHTFTCRYNGVVNGGCDTTGLDVVAGSVIANATLEIGATLEMTGPAPSGDDWGSFDVTVAYQ